MGAGARHGVLQSADIVWVCCCSPTEPGRSLVLEEENRKCPDFRVFRGRPRGFARSHSLNLIKGNQDGRHWVSRLGRAHKTVLSAVLTGK